MLKVIIAGSRQFNNYQLLCHKLNFYFQRYSTDQITIISGAARGADQLGERYAKERGIQLIQMPADWNQYGKSAGYKRNEQMAAIATHCIVFWDGESRGTKHMIDLAKQYNLKIRIVMF
jgi:YspA, cpYpsA-related SLOG family